MTRARVWSRATACCKYTGSHLESDGLAIETRSQSDSPKKLPETDAIFDTIKAKDHQSDNGSIKRLSLDCYGAVNIGEYSRGGQTRGNSNARDHDMGCEEKSIPCGLVDEDSGQLHLYFGSSHKTSDFIVDTLQDWWDSLTLKQQRLTELLQLKVDNGPESSGVRTPFLSPMVEFADQIGKPIQLLYYPPYPSKYNPIERCWGILEQHWNGTLLRDVTTMLAWAESMTWKGLHPTVTLNLKLYPKGISLSKSAMPEVELRLERNPKSDTPSKAGGLMSVTAPRAGVLAEGVCESIRIVHSGQRLPALGYNDARPPLQIQLLRRPILVPRNSPPQNCAAYL